MFFAVLLNALSAIAEINSMYAQRVIVEKHKTYAFYHPFSDVSSVASLLASTVYYLVTYLTLNRA